MALKAREVEQAAARLQAQKVVDRIEWKRLPPTSCIML